MEQKADTLCCGQQKGIAKSMAKSNYTHGICLTNAALQQDEQTWCVNICVAAKIFYHSSLFARSFLNFKKCDGLSSFLQKKKRENISQLQILISVRRLFHPLSL